VKLHLAARRMLSDGLAPDRVMEMNPVHAVHGPKRQKEQKARHLRRTARGCAFKHP